MWGHAYPPSTRFACTVRIPWRGLRSCGDRQKEAHHDQDHEVRIPWRGLMSCGEEPTPMPTRKSTTAGQNPLAGIEVMWGDRVRVVR